MFYRYTEQNNVAQEIPLIYHITTTNDTPLT